MIRCSVCSEPGGDWPALALHNGMTPTGGVWYCTRHLPLASEPEAVEPLRSYAVLTVRVARLATMAPAHIVASVRAHRAEGWARDYASAAVTELSRRDGWDLGRATFALGDVLEGLGMLAARAA